MPSVMTIEGAERGRCKRVRMGKKKGCTILLCKVGRRWKFQKGTSECRGRSGRKR